MRRFKNILYIATGSHDHRQDLTRAVELAENNQAKLRVVMVNEPISIGMGMPEGGPISERLQSALLRKCEERLESMIQPFAKRVAIETGLLLGTPFLEVIREVLRRKHDLVLKTAENPEWLDRLFGSDDMHILRKCPCPVWLLKSRAPSRFRNILAAVDVGDEQHSEDHKVQQALNDQVVQLSASLAVTEQAKLHIGHAWDEIDSERLRGRLLSSLDVHLKRYNQTVRQSRLENLQLLLDRLDSDLCPENLEIQMQLVEGSPRIAIPALASAVKADLVVMGTVARTGIPGLIVGNTAEMILSQINCAVLAVKPTGFRSPVEI